LIYRGVRMVNWDPKALTAISDEEVIHKEVNGKLYYLRYKIEGDEGYAVVATTRPETIMGDTAMCIHPENPKTAHLKGKRVIVPLINRVIPVIEDEYVDMEFGTGCLKVTPAHDVNDYVLGEKYNLPSIDIFNENGTLNEHGEMYAGMDRFAVRKKIEKDLEEAGLMEKMEAYTNKVGYSERTDVPIEPKLSMQWFLKMSDLAKPALDNVENDTVKFHPEKYKNTYRYWMENIKDWNISRQLWWGHRIPAYYCTPADGGQQVIIVAENENLAKAKADKHPKLQGGYEMRQDEDALDTWFSSWLWPISVFDGINNPDNTEIQYYYPTSDLVTGPDIIFFWVARMIMSGYEYRNQECFKNVYFTGIVRDKIGRKMSKQLGNSPDPIELMKQFGADGVRMGMLLTAPAGNDLLYDDSLCEQGRNFNNKIWNAFRLVKGWEVADVEQSESAKIAIEWFEAQLSKTLLEVEDLFGKYRLSEALMAVYKLFWDEFSSWYLEMIKPAYEHPIDQATYNATLGFFDSLLKMLHPFMPFITEEIYRHLITETPSIVIAPWPIYKEEYNFTEALQEMSIIMDAIKSIRNIRAEMNVPPSKTTNVIFVTQEDSIREVINQAADFFKKLSWVSGISIVNEKSGIPKNAANAVIPGVEIFIPIEELIDITKEIERLEKEISNIEKELARVNEKLSNINFITKAPQNIVEEEKTKKIMYEEMYNKVRERIQQLKLY